MKLSFLILLFAKLVVSQTVIEVINGRGALSTLSSLLDQAGLSSGLNRTGPFTVFAPRDRAFNALDADTLTRLSDPEWWGHLEDILSYHVTSPGFEEADFEVDQTLSMLNLEAVKVTSTDPAVTLNDQASINNPDNMADNGVVHVVDAVLLPESATKSMVNVLADDFSELSDLIISAGLIDIVFGDGPFTLFAPTNEAIQTSFGQETLDLLQGDDGADYLKKMLEYHLVEGNYYSSSFMDGSNITMSNGDPLEITFEYEEVVDSGNATETNVTDTTTAVGKSGHTVEGKEGEYSIRLNDFADVTELDIMVTNGVIHVINGVLLPSLEPEDTALGLFE